MIITKTIVIKKKKKKKKNNNNKSQHSNTKNFVQLYVPNLPEMSQLEERLQLMNFNHGKVISNNNTNENVDGKGNGNGNERNGIKSRDIKRVDEKYDKTKGIRNNNKKINKSDNSN